MIRVTVVVQTAAAMHTHFVCGSVNDSGMRTYVLKVMFGSTRTYRSESSLRLPCRE